MIVMIIVGGLGCVTGAVLGAFFVGVTLELMRDLQQYRLVAYALLLDRDHAGSARRACSARASCAFPFVKRSKIGPA